MMFSFEQYAALFGEANMISPDPYDHSTTAAAVSSSSDHHNHHQLSMTSAQKDSVHIHFDPLLKLPCTNYPIAHMESREWLSGTIGEDESDNSAAIHCHPPPPPRRHQDTDDPSSLFFKARDDEKNGNCIVTAAPLPLHHHCFMASNDLCANSTSGLSPLKRRALNCEYESLEGGGDCGCGGTCSIDIMAMVNTNNNALSATNPSSCNSDIDDVAAFAMNSTTTSASQAAQPQQPICLSTATSNKLPSAATTTTTLRYFRSNQSLHHDDSMTNNMTNLVETADSAASYSTLSNEFDSSHIVDSNDNNNNNHAVVPSIRTPPFIRHSPISGYNNEIVSTGHAQKCDENAHIASVLNDSAAGIHANTAHGGTNNNNNNGNQVSVIECVVCGDKSSGKHYGQYTCEGCKSFFKRTVRRNLEYKCRGNDQCPVDQQHRNQCQSCRYRKCRLKGMRKESVQKGRSSSSSSLSNQYNIMNASCVNRRCSQQVVNIADTFKANSPLFRQRSQQAFAAGGPLLNRPQSTYHHHRFTSNPSEYSFFNIAPASTQLIGTPASMSTTTTTSSSTLATAETTVFVQQLSAETTSTIDYGRGQDGNIYDLSDNYYKCFLSNLFQAEIRVGQNGQEFHRDCLQNVDSVFETIARLLFMTIQWAREIPIFMELSIEDRICLLQSTWSHIFLVKVAQANVPFEAVHILKNESARYKASGLKHETCDDDDESKTLMSRVEKLRQMNMDTAEYSCLKASILFSPEAPGLCDPEKISSLQEQSLLALNEYLKPSHGNDVRRVIKIWLQAALIKSIPSDVIEQLFFIQMVARSKMQSLITNMLLNRDLHCSFNAYRNF